MQNKSRQTVATAACPGAVMPEHRPAALTIAGSDSGAGAGLQADLQAFAACGVFGVCAVTCITAQNPGAVNGVHPVDPDMILAQIASVWDEFRIQAVKTGMLYSAAIIDAVAADMRRRRPKILVVDPVMVAGSGARLLRDDAVETLCAQLLPVATVATPNIPEAEILAGHAIKDHDGQLEAAATIADRWNLACVLKGGHLYGQGKHLVNVIAGAGRVESLRIPRLRGAKTHGTGCTFAAALTAAMALGLDVFEASAYAGKAVAAALANRPAVGKHYPLNWPGIEAVNLKTPVTVHDGKSLPSL